MEKNNVKKMFSKVITKAGMKSARVDANNACVYVLYQPKYRKLSNKKWFYEWNVFKIMIAKINQ